MSPPCIHVFLWLLANNKILTRDNLAKRRTVDDLTCLFCSEDETCHHLFFDCFVAKLVWPVISDMCGIRLGDGFDSIAKLWLSNSRNSAVNVVCAAVLWALWKLRNDMCFQGKTWPGVKDIWRRVAAYLELWKVLSKGATSELLARNARLLNKKRGEVMRIAWR